LQKNKAFLRFLFYCQKILLWPRRNPSFINLSSGRHQSGDNGNIDDFIFREHRIILKFL